MRNRENVEQNEYSKLGSSSVGDILLPTLLRGQGTVEEPADNREGSCEKPTTGRTEGKRGERGPEDWADRAHADERRNLDPGGGD